MRAVVLALLVAGVAAPALAQTYPVKQPCRDPAELGRQAEREATARRLKARREATLRAIRAGELAGGPSAAFRPYHPSDIEPLAPRIALADLPPPELTGDAARADALMAAAMARSQARVKAISPDTRR